jgi:hypothetical protein
MSCTTNQCIDPEHLGCIYGPSYRQYYILPVTLQPAIHFRDFYILSADFMALDISVCRNFALWALHHKLPDWVISHHTSIRAANLQ